MSLHYSNKKINNLSLRVRIIFIILAFCVVVSSLVVPISYAWFYKNAETEAVLNFGDGRIEISAYWDYGGSLTEVAIQKGSMLELELSDANKIAYYKNLRVKIKLDIIGDYYLRVQLNEIWLKRIYTGEKDNNGEEIYEEEPVRGPITQFELDTNYWIDNRKSTENFANDLYVYYNNKNAPVGTDPYLIKNTSSVVLDVIKSVPDLSVNDPNIHYYIKISAMAVQKNRYKEFWLIDKLPTR